MSITLIIPAAGSGKRMGQTQKKQFLSLEGVPIIIRTLKAFIDFDEIEKVIVVTAKEDINEMLTLIKKYALKNILCIEGGSERQDSVYNALLQVQTPYVMIHDGARPFISREIIASNIELLKSRDALITGIKVKDTIKEVSDGIVLKTLKRSQLIQVQTPQCFKTELLKKSYDHANTLKLSVTDDASVVEAFGEKVWLVEGSSNNVKITVPEDLILGSFILRSMI